MLNYGLFQPATSGRDANFLEEERLLREYPQSFEKGVPYLEVRPQKSCPGTHPLQVQKNPPVGSSRLPESKSPAELPQMVFFPLPKLLMPSSEGIPTTVILEHSM